ncbi:MAG TPA: hypothetical protein PKD45_07355, partial [Flavobacteriales bacterium]|nr:hypothetical protein [Flavobacteriales bacterium]
MATVWGMNAHAAHVLGGDITYTCQGGNNFLVTLDLFYDCSGVAALPQTLHFTSACGNQSVVVQPPPPVEVSQICTSQLANSTCNGGGLQGVNLYSFQTVVNLPPCPGGWNIHWVSCCRAITRNLVGASGTYIDAQLRNDLNPCPTSPEFNENTVPYICVGQPFNYNFGVSGGSGSYLSFNLIGARGYADTSQPINYQGGFSGGFPVPGSIMDPVTGQLLFTPPQTGKYVFVVQVNQYDAAGNIIGTVMRDIMFIAMPCTGSPPSVQGPATIVGPDDGILYLGNNTIEVCNGAPFCFALSFSDPDAADVLAVTSQAASLMPGSTTTVSGTNPITVTVCWTGDINHTPVNLLFQTNDGACPIMNTVSVGVNISSVIPLTNLPDPGTNANVQVCPTAVPFNLLDQLGGTPNATGFWTAPNGSVHGPQFNPATDVAGVYTYTVGNACSNATATVTVSFTASNPNAGVNGSLNVCANSAPVALITGLGGTPDLTGTWTRQSDGAAVGPNFNPATQAPGVFVYTVPGAGGCASASATVTVSVIQPSNAGANGTLATCSNGVPVSLFAQLGGTPDAGGTWTGPSAVTGGMYNPATMAPGVYTYTVAGTAPCANATATVTVTESTPPDAGANGTLDVCSNGAPVNLFAQLGGTPDAGGTWSGPSAVTGGMYNPATMAPGVYTYTVAGTAPCANATATVTVDRIAAPVAGTNGMLDVCSNGAPESLFAQLGGSPDAGGTWTGPSAVTNSQYDPATMDPGVYTYTVTGQAPCGNATATVTVTENNPPNAGLNGTLDVCANGGVEDLFAALGGTPDAGGAWTGPSTVTNDQYDPATMTPGVYTYTVAGAGPCGNATATVTVDRIAAPVAGTNGTLDVCANGAPESLFAQLGGSPDAGGTWTGPSAVTGGLYDPATMAPGVYTYTVAGTAPCANATATVTVTESTPPDAGANGTLDVCSNGAPVNLFAQLGGTPDAGGTWSGPSAVTGGMYDPATMAPGVYTYMVAGTAPCANATATVTVTESTPPDAGTNGTLDVCSNGTPESLFTQLGGSPDAGGGWTGPSAVTGGLYDPATMAPGVYTYTVAGTAPCANATATVTVTESTPPDAGTDGTLDVCSNGAATSLFAALGGTPNAGGTWTGPSAVTGGMYDPATMTPGVYTYTVAGAGPCGNATATVTVDRIAAPVAGTNGTLDVCANGAPESLFAQLGGMPDAGGTWTGPSAVTGGMYDPVTMNPGVYTYTVTGQAPCGTASATVTVTETGSPNAGTDGAVTVCSDGAPVDLFAQLGGSPDAGGTWSGGLVNGLFDPAMHAAGTYTYTLAATPPCQGDQSQVVVTVAAAPDAGSDASLTVCDQGAPTSLFAQLGGMPDAGGTWTGPSAV